jgi:hypothetical protein
LARVAAPTAEAERNVSSSPVREVVSGAPPGGGFAPGEWRVTDATRTGPEALSRRGGVAVAGFADGDAYPSERGGVILEPEGRTARIAADIPGF